MAIVHLAIHLLCLHPWRGIAVINPSLFLFPGQVGGMASGN